MSIQVVCRNGHSLKVKESLAGKQWLCPVCKSQIQVPRIEADVMSEDVVMDILGPKLGAPATRPTSPGTPKAKTAASNIPAPQPAPVTTILIEQTSKRFKLIRLVGMLLMVAAVVPAVVSSDSYGPSNVGGAISGVIGVAGVLCWGYGMALSWWHHG